MLQALAYRPLGYIQRLEDRPPKHAHPMNLRATYEQLQEILEGQIEPFEAIALVERYRQYFKPREVKVVLLAESHVFTTTEDTGISIPAIAGLPGYPSQYAKFVYCLGYGERQLTMAKHHPSRDGTPQFWKIFYSCTNRIERTEDFSPVLGSTPTQERIRNKVKTLLTIKANGVWLVDTSVAALYDKGKKHKNMHEALRTSWRLFTKEAVLSCNPRHVICIGKGVAQSVEGDLRAHLGDRYSVVAQPNAFLSSEEHMANYLHYSRVCNAW